MGISTECRKMWIDTNQAYAVTALHRVNIAGEWDGRDFLQTSISTTVQE
jgi:hypothetical protein